jgi:hypothetical protein
MFYDNSNLFVVLYVTRVVVGWSDGYEVSPYVFNTLHFPSLGFVGYTILVVTSC